MGLPSTVTWDSFVLLGVELLFPEPSLLPFSWFIPLIWGAHFPVVSLEWCLGSKSLERTCLSANVFAPISRASCFARYTVVFLRKVESETPSSSASNAPAEESEDFPGGKPSVCDSLPPDLLDCFSSRTLKSHGLPWCRAQAVALSTRLSCPAVLRFSCVISFIISSVSSF